jgi:hypothetical protein
MQVLEVNVGTGNISVKSQHYLFDSTNINCFIPISSTYFKDITYSIDSNDNFLFSSPTYNSREKLSIFYALPELSNGIDLGDDSINKSITALNQSLDNISNILIYKRNLLRNINIGLNTTIIANFQSICDSFYEQCYTNETLSYRVSENNNNFLLLAGDIIQIQITLVPGNSLNIPPYIYKVNMIMY